MTTIAPYTQAPYRGVIVGTRVSLCSPIQNGVSPTTIPIRIAWRDYPTGCVVVNFQSGTSNPLDAIRSVKIDNLSTPAAVYVSFPDTRDEIIASIDSTAMSVVLTGQLQAIIYNNNPSAASSAFSVTTVYFNNFQIDPNATANLLFTENQQLISGIGSQGNVPLRTPSAGDNYFTRLYFLTSVGIPSRSQIFTPFAGAAFICISEISMTVLGCYSDQAYPQIMQFGIVDGTGQTYYIASWSARNDLLDYSGKVILRNVNQQVLLKANTIYYAQNFLNALPGYVQLDITYTTTAI